MIHEIWPFLAAILLAAGLFPTLEQRFGWRVFSVLPPIVLTYLLVTGLSVCGLWSAEEGSAIAGAQGMLISQLLPTLLFLLLATCDLREVLALGPRPLAAFFCASTSICLAFVLVYLLVGSLLPAWAWMPLSAINGGWIGGTANLLAVKASIGMSDSMLSPALLTDAICYSIWVVALFSATPLTARFNRWARAESTVGKGTGSRTVVSASPGLNLLWLGLALLITILVTKLAAQLPISGVLTMTSWKLLLATGAGLVVAQTPLARLPGSTPLASALLAILVAVMASQSNFAGLLTAPLFIMSGLMVMVLHALMMVGAARLFQFDLALCSVASLANIGGVASAPLLAAAHSPALVPIGVLMAMLGYVLGTGAGLLMASVLSSLA